MRLDHCSYMVDGSYKWRAMQSKDLDAVLKIERNTQSVPWSRLAFEESLTKSEQPAESLSICEVISLGDENDEPGSQELIAFIVVSLVLDELHILNLAVANLHQGRGFGHVILDRIISLANQHGSRKLFLEVRASNLVAQSLYKKWGFEQIAIRKAYYRAVEQQREDAQVFVKQLPSG